MLPLRGGSIFVRNFGPIPHEHIHVENLRVILLIQNNVLYLQSKREYDDFTV